MRRLAFALLVSAMAGPAHAQGADEHFDAGTIRAADLPKNAPRFESYSVEEIYTGASAVPDVRSHPRSRKFRTRILEGATRGPNFAGHYTIVRWGCGSGCAAHAIVDARSGAVYHPTAFESVDDLNVASELENPEGTLVKYRLNSKLLIVIGGINEDPRLRGISYFVWDKNRLSRIRFVHRPPTGP